MAEHVLIDGNNLLYAMHAHAPLPQVGRETLVKLIERWAGKRKGDVTLVFDGPVPREGLARQMTSGKITVLFSAPVTADDIIVSLIDQAMEPTALRVVSSDTAIRHEARHRRCACTDVVEFVAELFPPQQRTVGSTPAANPPAEKPETLSPEEAQAWLDAFGIDDTEEPFKGHDAMNI
jgi:predicted RNA-binding protein with PIN domain